MVWRFALIYMSTTSVRLLEINDKGMSRDLGCSILRGLLDEFRAQTVSEHRACLYANEHLYFGCILLCETRDVYLSCAYLKPSFLAVESHFPPSPESAERRERFVSPAARSLCRSPGNKLSPGSR